MTHGDEYQRMSKYKQETMHGKSLDWSKKPATYKVYPPELERVELDKPNLAGGMPYNELLRKRRTERVFTDTPIPKRTLSQIIWAAQGITLVSEHQQLRTAPSAGALYPVETYCVVTKVQNIKPGVYHYQVPYHNLVLLKEGLYGPALANAALGQTMPQLASFVLIWSAVVERSKWKYEQRAYRYIYLDAGHIAQNAVLAATSCGLGSCPIGSFFDEEVDNMIGVNGKSETAIYILAVGKA